MKRYSFTISMIIACSLWLTIGTAQTNNITSDDLLKLRNLQYEQAKRVVRMQDLKNEFDRLNLEQQNFAKDIDSWIKDQAKKQNIDLTKYQFDLDQLKFVEIKKNE